MRGGIGLRDISIALFNQFGFPIAASAANPFHAVGARSKDFGPLQSPVADAEIPFATFLGIFCMPDGPSAFQLTAMQSPTLNWGLFKRITMRPLYGLILPSVLGRF
jgi:hypothetical protein